jgi:RNA polymerase sigma-70 factor (ECF subfamily)
MPRKGLDFVALDEALNRLAQIDPQQGQIVELRLFSALSVEETAKLLDVSELTIK